MSTPPTTPEEKRELANEIRENAERLFQRPSLAAARPDEELIYEFPAGSGQVIRFIRFGSRSGKAGRVEARYWKISPSGRYVPLPFGISITTPSLALFAVGAAKALELELGDAPASNAGRNGSGGADATPDGHSNGG